MTPGSPKGGGTVCSTFAYSSSTDCTCNLYHQQSSIWTFCKVVAVRSRAWEDSVEREKRLSYLKCEKNPEDMSVSENWLSWIWGWTISKHVKSNCVGSFDFFFPFTLLKAWFYYFFKPVFPVPCIEIKQVQIQAICNKLCPIWLQDIILILPDLDFIQLCVFISRKAISNFSHGLLDWVSLFIIHYFLYCQLWYGHFLGILEVTTMNFQVQMKKVA